MADKDAALEESEALEHIDEQISASGFSPIEKEKESGGVRTYATDIADMMREEKGSIIKIALAEQKRRDEFKKKLDPTATKNLIVMMIGFILIVGGVMIFIYSLVNRVAPVANVTPTNVVFPSLLFTENQVQIDMTDLNKAELYDAIAVQVANKTLGAATMNNLYISEKTTAGQASVLVTKFLAKLGFELPDTLFQNLSPQFMLATYAREPKNNLFLILKVKDFNEAFPAMREWEEKMLSDFLRLFKIDTSVDGKAIFNKSFETVTLFNKEARVLKDSKGNVLLSYIFLDPKTIMITTETSAVEEVIKRLNLQTLK